MTYDGIQHWLRCPQCGGETVRADARGDELQFECFDCGQKEAWREDYYDE